MATISQGNSARSAVIEGREYLFFGGCSYLGLASHPRVLEAASTAASRFGLSTGAARSTSGTTTLHVALERELAEFTGAEDCALLPDAALADLGLALARIAEGTRVFVDPQAHPCIRDAIRAAGALGVAGEDVEAARRDGCTVAFTDGTFPTEARSARVEELVEAGFTLVAVDDAHGFGLLGERGAGAAEELDLTSDGQALVIALSKCFGAAGGAVLGSRETVEAVRATSPYACTTAPPPALVAAARVALAIVREEPERRARCFENAATLHRIVDRVDPQERSIHFPARALALEEEGHIQRVHASLGDAGILVPLIRYPGGPAADYLRFAVTAEHTEADLERLESALKDAIR